MLNQDQKKWIEDNYDLVETAARTYAESDDEIDEIESCAALVLCESFDAGMDTAENLRELVEAFFCVVIPKMIEHWRRERQCEYCVDQWEDFERGKFSFCRRGQLWDDSVDWDGDFSE